MEVLTLYPDISNLEREYNAAVAREQSLANRMLGAAAIGAGGIGGMMLASGIAEQRADANAERDMTAHTRHCRVHCPTRLVRMQRNGRRSARIHNHN